MEPRKVNVPLKLRPRDFLHVSDSEYSLATPPLLPPTVARYSYFLNLSTKRRASFFSGDESTALYESVRERVEVRGGWMRMLQFLIFLQRERRGWEKDNRMRENGKLFGFEKMRR